MKLKKKKEDFTDLVCMSDTIRSSLSRGTPVYRPGKRPDLDKERAEFRDALMATLRKTAKRYESKVPESAHIKNIQGISDSLSQSPYKKALLDERFRIGRAQKALNLYLKNLWCLGKILEPPHCPLDNRILYSVKIFASWTAMDNISEYRKWIKTCRVIASKKDMSLSVWELTVFPDL